MVDEDAKPDLFTQESAILIEKMYSDDLLKIKSLDSIQDDLPEQKFYIQKSNLSIFRYEDVIFNLFPHLGALKRRGATCKEIFQNNDPFKDKSTSNPIDAPIQGGGFNMNQSERNESRILN